MKTVFIAIVAILSVSLTAYLVKSNKQIAHESNIEERIKYWEGELKTNLPAGSTKKQVEEFFADRGEKIICCVTYPQHDISNATVVKDKKSYGGSKKIPIQLNIAMRFKDGVLVSYQFVQTLADPPGW